MSKSRSKKARQNRDEWVVQPGTEVFDVNGRKIGGVTDIQAGDLLVHKGGLFQKDYRIPVSAVATHTDVRIDLSLSVDEVTGTHAHQPEAVTAPSSTDEVPSTDGQEVTMREPAADQGAVDGERTEVLRVPVIEEQLDPSRHQVERGQVRLETVVTEHEATIEVPVTEERVRVQRIPVDRLATAADLAVDGRTLNVAVYGEEVDLATRSRVIEEVVISKDAVAEIREVSGTVRREDVTVVDETTTRDATESDMSKTIAHPDTRPRS